MSQVRRHFIDARFGQLHVRTAGEPSQSAILLLHMSPKSSKQYANVMRALGETHFVIAPDYPGMGESDLPPAEPEVTVVDYAKSALEAVAHFGLQSFAAIGYHTGALVAAEIGHLVPEQVQRVVMIGAVVLTQEEVDAMHAKYSPIPLDLDGTRFRKLWEAVVFHRGEGMTLEMMAASFAESLRGGEAYEWGHRAAFNYAPVYPDRVRSLTVPITVLNPADDLEEESRRIVPYLNDQPFIEYPDWNHGFFDVHPQLAASRLIAAVRGEAAD